MLKMDFKLKRLKQQQTFRKKRDVMAYMKTGKRNKFYLNGANAAKLQKIRQGRKLQKEITKKKKKKRQFL